MQTDRNAKVQPIQEGTAMECDKVWDLLSVYADGEATPHEAAMVEGHVAVCPNCARDLKFMQGTHQVLQDVPEVEPPATLRTAILAATVYRPNFGQRLVTAVRKTLTPAPVRYGALAAAGAAAALTALVLRNGENVPVAPNATPPVVATAPTTPSVPAMAAEPDVDLLDAYEPPAVAASREIHQRRPRRQPIALASVALPRSRPAHPKTTAALRNTAHSSRDASEEGVPEDLPQASAPTDINVTQPDPEPVTRLVAGAPSEPSYEPSAEAVSGAARSTRIVLTASAMALDPQQVATLADLRKNLSRGENEDRAALAKLTRDKQIRLDVLRGSF